MREIIKKTNREQLILIGMMMLLFPVILFSTGTITSGWHLIDDHETVRLVEERLRGDIPFWSALKKEWINDITHRWRPAYWFFRVLGAYMFGINSAVHNFFLCCMGMICYWLLYKTARNLSCGIICSHLFVTFIILGRQYEVWYRIANQENIGLFFLAICLWIISYQYKKGDFSKRVYDIILLGCAIICSLIKESFFLVFPAVILLRIGLEGIGSSGGIKKWIHLLIKRAYFWMTAFIAFLWSSYMIFFYVGTAPISYAGVDMDEGWKQVCWNVLRMPKESLEDYVWVTLPFVGLAIFCFIFHSKCLKKISLGHVFWLLFGFYIVIGQIILYARSGMWNRYLIPFTIGVGLIFIIFAEHILINKYIYFLYLSILLLFLGTRAYITVVNRAIPYAEEGRATQQMLHMIAENTTEDSYILITLGSREENTATAMYLGYLGRNNTFYFKENDDNQLSDNRYCDLDNINNIKWEAVVINADKAELENQIQFEGEWKKEQLAHHYVVWMRK